MVSDAEAIKAIMREQHFWAGASAPMLDALASASRIARFPAGGTICREGSENSFLYILSSGHVGLDMHVPARGRVRILSLGPGEMLAWSAILGDGHMTATATALDDTEMVCIAGQDLVRICGANPELGYQLMTRVAGALAKRLVATRLQFLDLFAAPAAHGALEGN
jgi:CRP-like cAMP-binding protein